MKKRMPSLKIHRETLHSLEATETSKVRGGIYDPSWREGCKNYTPPS